MGLAPDTVVEIALRLAEYAGLELPAWVVEARATARIALFGCSPDDYVELLDGEHGLAELGELIEAVRVGESRLFRHRAQVDVIDEVVAPALRARGQRAVRVWSAGCAAGEEPYTLALVLSQALPDREISILATDISAEALARARAATYPRAALDHVPEPYRGKFLIEGDAIRVAPEIAQLVRFERANLLNTSPARGCDLVWCRNVLIYFTAEARRRAIERLVHATAPDGFVFVGYSESLRDIAELEARRAGDAVYYVRRGPDATRRPRSPSAPVAPPPERRPRPPSAFPVAPVPAVARPSPPAAPASLDTVALIGHPAAAHVTAELSARFALPGLRALRIDLDGAELLGEELAPVLRRARAAARAAGIALEVRATRPGARRWLARHGLDEEPR